MTYKAVVLFDIDGVIRDVTHSYRRAIADTVEYFTEGNYRPTMEDIDHLKAEGLWNNDWKASQELVDRYYATQKKSKALDYETIVTYFQEKYRGKNWDGYITTEPLLMGREYTDNLHKNNIAFGFVSGATRGSAEYVLKKRIGLENIILIAMEDAPSKPNPQGLFLALEQLQITSLIPVFYVGDTVADILTIVEAKKQQPERLWKAIGILPPHINANPEKITPYSQQLKNVGADLILPSVEHLIPDLILSSSNLS